MRRDPRCYLWDALRATGSIQAFVRGKTYEAFVEDDLVRSAVERQLQIIGEALSQLAKVDPQIASNVADWAASSSSETFSCTVMRRSITTRCGA